MSREGSQAPRALALCVPLTTENRGSRYEVPMPRVPWLRLQNLPGKLERTALALPNNGTACFDQPIACRHRATGRQSDGRLVVADNLWPQIVVKKLVTPHDFFLCTGWERFSGRSLSKPVAVSVAHESIQVQLLALPSPSEGRCAGLRRAGSMSGLPGDHRRAQTVRILHAERISRSTCDGWLNGRSATDARCPTGSHHRFLAAQGTPVVIANARRIE